MSSKDHEHLNELSKLRFLIIDEVDRMISKGNYPQLVSIFDAINKANPALPDSEPIKPTLPEDGNDDRLKSLEGVPGEAKVIMLSDEILRHIDSQKQGYKTEIIGDNEDEGSHVESFESSLHFDATPIVDDDDDDQSNQSSGTEEMIHRQTFVFSATLSLPVSSHQVMKKSSIKVNKKGKPKDSSVSVQSTIHDILKTAGARGQLKFVDLSSDQTNFQSNYKSVGPSKREPVSVQLPPGLSFYEIACTKKHKDSHLYAFLTTTKQGSSGPCLIFCNSIAAVKRVGQTLRILGLPVRTLHGHMEQKARLSAMETLKGKDSRVILVATDVCARGLDIPSVATVLHYDVARAVDTFVHRAGRTARGMGPAAVGASVSLVDPSEEKEHRKICEMIQGQGKKRFEQSPMDGHLLVSAQTRVALASKIVDCEQIESRCKKNNDWIRVAAADADLDVDDDLLDEGLVSGSLRDQQRLKEVAHARLELKKLLAVPMKKQHFGKFLSGIGMQNSINSTTIVKPFVVGERKHMKRKSRK